MVEYDAADFVGGVGRSLSTGDDSIDGTGLRDHSYDGFTCCPAVTEILVSSDTVLSVDITKLHIFSDEVSPGSFSASTNLITV